MRGLMKIAGGNHLHEMNVDAFLAQAEEYEAGGDLRDSVLKILNVLPRTHPFTTVRAAELKKWAESRDFQRIMDGHYPRRDEDKDTSVSDSFRESAASYADTVKNSQGPADEAGPRHRRRRGRPRRPGARRASAAPAAPRRPKTRLRTTEPTQGRAGLRRSAAPPRGRDRPSPGPHPANDRRHPHTFGCAPAASDPHSAVAPPVANGSVPAGPPCLAVSPASSGLR